MRENGSILEGLYKNRVNESKMSNADYFDVMDKQDQLLTKIGAEYEDGVYTLKKSKIRKFNADIMNRLPAGTVLKFGKATKDTLTKRADGDFDFNFKGKVERRSIKSLESTFTEYSGSQILFITLPNNE